MNNIKFRLHFLARKRNAVFSFEKNRFTFHVVPKSHKKNDDNQSYGILEENKQCRAIDHFGY